jgi:hypothetical protein
MMKPEGPIGSVTAVHVKRMTLKDFVQTSGIQMGSRPPVPWETYVYVAVASGNLGFDGDPSGHPWLLSVVVASPPYNRPVLLTAGTPGAGDIPSWWVAAPDTLAS